MPPYKCLQCGLRSWIGNSIPVNCQWKTAPPCGPFTDEHPAATPAAASVAAPVPAPWQIPEIWENVLQQLSGIDMAQAYHALIRVNQEIHANTVSVTAGSVRMVTIVAYESRVRRYQSSCRNALKSADAIPSGVILGKSDKAQQEVKSRLNKLSSVLIELQRLRDQIVSFLQEISGRMSAGGLSARFLGDLNAILPRLFAMIFEIDPIISALTARQTKLNDKHMSIWCSRRL
jgi:hypothetical protein